MIPAYRDALMAVHWRVKDHSYRNWHDIGFWRSPREMGVSGEMAYPTSVAHRT